MNSLSYLAFKAGNLWLVNPSTYEIVRNRYIELLVRDENDRIMRVSFFDAFDLMSWGLSSIDQNEPTMVPPADLPEIHFHKMPGLLHMFLNDTFLQIPHNHRFPFNDSQIGLMFNKVNDAGLRFTPENKVLR